MRRVLGKGVGLAIGAALSAIIFALTALSFFWTPYSPTAIAILNRLQRPSAAHWLGTDPFGRDVASMLMVGAQNSLSVALVGVTIGLVLGVSFGAVAAARGGLLDDALMRMSDIAFAFPALLTAVMLTALFGADGSALLRDIGITTIPAWAAGMASGLNAMLAIGIFNFPVFALITRGAAMSLWKREFFTAARAFSREPSVYSPATRNSSDRRWRRFAPVASMAAATAPRSSGAAMSKAITFTAMAFASF